MSDKPEYIYITYPIPADEAGRLPLPPFFRPAPAPPFPSEDESFMPLWFGNACFPEDDTD